MDEQSHPRSTSLRVPEPFSHATTFIPSSAVSALHLSRLLFKNHSIKTFILANRRFSEGELCEILASLSTMPPNSIRHIDFSCMDLDERCVRHVADYIAGTVGLERVNLSRNKISPSGIEYLASKILDHPTLLHLDLSECHMGAQGFENFLSSIPTEKLRLNSLVLSHNLIGNDGGALLVEQLRRNQHLKKCVLKGNFIHHSYVEAVEEFLARNRDKTAQVAKEDKTAQHPSLLGFLARRVDTGFEMPSLQFLQRLQAEECA